MMSKIIKILYGSETGNAQSFAEQIWHDFYSRCITTQCMAMDDYSINLLPQEEFVIFIVSTSGNGDVPTNMRKSWTYLLSKRLTEGYLEKLKFVLLGLGDSSYTKYNFAGKKLYRRLIQLGAKPLVDLALANDQDLLGIDEVFEKWSKEIFEIKEFFTDQTSTTSTIPKFYFDILLENDNNTQCCSNNFYPLKIIQNIRVTHEDHFQETRLVSFCIKDVKEDFRYSPGDVLMISPENLNYSIQIAKNVLKRCDNLWNVPISICRSNINVPISPQFKRLFSSQKLTLNDLFVYYFDLQCIPKRSFIKNFAEIAKDELEKERLFELSSPEGIDDYFEYCIYSKRSLFEFLRDFPKTSSLLYINDFLNFFPIIRPRAFSICSSPTKHFEKIQILVARVEYNIRRIKTPRLGLCSNFLCLSNPGQQVYARINPGIFKLNQDVVPLILIGPGTGIAPFRSIIIENEFYRKCPIILFFGCRNENMDYYFKDEWLNYSKLKLFTAFSRDQGKKIYVQQRINENSKELWNLINCGAQIFIAGSAGDMPKQVILEIKQIIINEGNISLNEADKFIELLEKKKIIQYETWS